MTSEQWLAYYQHNSQSLLDIPWHLGPELTPEESAAIAGSLRAFQAGESSEGKHLYKYAKAYAVRTGDHDYVPVIRLFIAEEQRHARDLGRFLVLNHIALIRTTFTDRVFRSLRHLLGGLEMSIAVLITAEIIAKVYYAALCDATSSRILRTMCEQILQDEVRHVEFQAEQLIKLRRARGRLGRLLTMALQRFLFFGTSVVVGLLHHKVISRGGLSFVTWWRRCWTEFALAFRPQVVTPDRTSPISHPVSVVSQNVGARSSAEIR
jgi:hypothetical protein